MKTEELETIVLFNRKDAKEGFFTVGTSIASNAERIIKRVGDKNILDLELSKDSTSGRVIYWNFKLPIQLYQRTTFGVRKSPRVGIKEVESNTTNRDEV